MLGCFAGKYATTSSNELFINNADTGSYSNDQTTSLVYGTFNGTTSAQTFIANAKLTATYGLIVSTILYVNQIPDIESDRLVGKLTLATKIKKKHIWLYYLLISMCSYMTIVVGCSAGKLSWGYLSVGTLLPIHIYATHLLRSHISNRGMLKKSIVITIMTAHLFGLLLIINNMI